MDICVIDIGKSKLAGFRQILRIQKTFIRQALKTQKLFHV
jgi:hypothetical protein